VTRKIKLVRMETSPVSAWAFLHGQLRYLSERGYDVTVITAPGPELEETGRREGVRTIAVPMKRPPAPVHDLVSLKRLTSIFRELRPDIIHYGTPKASLLGGLAGVLARVPIRLMVLRGMRADGLEGPMRQVMLAMERVSCLSAHRVYCVSESLKQRAIELRLAAPGKLKVIGDGSGNGILAERFTRTAELQRRADALRQRVGLPRGVPVVGFVGRLVTDKGVAELVAAFQQLKAIAPDLHLLLVGPFEDYDGLAPEVRDQILSDPAIRHMDFTHDPAPAYALMDVLALPTYREGFPMVPLEAACMELPVVATTVTGCVDAVGDGETGTMTPPRDADRLAPALKNYLPDPMLRRRHGCAGRERVLEKFQSERMWELMDEEYRELLRQHGRQALATAPEQSMALPLALSEGHFER
jgi:glycosyltransferase involved in cell wall biosynthesis